MTGMGCHALALLMMSVIVVHHCSIPLRRHKKYSTGITTNVRW